MNSLRWNLIDVDKWQEIYSTLKRHKLRTALTMFGVFWGVFMLVILLGMSNGLENGVLAGFGGMKNSVWVFPGRPSSVVYQGLPTGRQVIFTDEDMLALGEKISDIEWLIGVNNLSSQRVERGKKNEIYSINGAYPQTLQLESQKVLEGRFFNALDMREQRKVAVLGAQIVPVLFALDESPVGAAITINGISFRVIGVYSGSDESTHLDEVYIPNSALRKAFGQTDRIGRFILTPKAGVKADVIERQVKALLKKRHRISPDDSGTISSFNIQQRYEKFQALFTGITAFSWMVAVGTIIAGVIGVGNIMLITVKERTREIGVRKALGATPISIVTMIVQESLLLSGLSGYLGMVVGVLSLQGVASLLNAGGGGGGYFDNPEINFSTAVLAIIILMVAGALAALLPAAKAAKINPVEALQEQ